MDRITPTARSAIMARVSSKNTAPELRVRSALFRSGYRFRLHKRGLPGSPDIVLKKYATVVFVHGCFWHGHDCKKGRLRPQTNSDRWNKKLDRNIERDREVQRRLVELGWRVKVIWTCQLTEGIDELICELKEHDACGRR